MQNKLQELTDKIYQEGVSKANEEAEKIMGEAGKESKRIIDEAEKKAKAIIEEAEKKAEEIIKNGNSELKISFRHAVNTLKQDLEKTISARLVSEKVTEAFKDDNFVTDLIKTIYQNWKPETSGSPMEVLVSKEKSETLEKSLKAAIGAELGKDLIVKPVGTIKTGFEIVSSGGGFKISATGGDIEAYLKEFIRPKLINILFE
jgi:V/A-type H+/Na+-transporting ATPase subunit E